MSAKDKVSAPPVQASDSAEWAELYRGYRAFYVLAPDDSVVERVWSWINNDAHESMLSSPSPRIASSGSRTIDDLPVRLLAAWASTSTIYTHPQTLAVPASGGHC